MVIWSRFVTRRGLLALAAASPLGLLWPHLASAASQGALGRLAARLESLGDDGLDPRHYDLPSGAALRDREALMARAELALRDLVLGRVAALPGRVDIRRDPARADFPAWRERLFASADPANVIEQAAALHTDAAPIKAELARFRAIAARGGWPLIEGNLTSTLEPGTQDAARVRQWAADRDALRERLAPLLGQPVPPRLRALVLGQAEPAQRRWLQAAMAAGLLLAALILFLVLDRRRTPALPAVSENL